MPRGLDGREATLAPMPKLPPSALVLLMDAERSHIRLQDIGCHPGAGVPDAQFPSAEHLNRIDPDEF